MSLLQKEWKGNPDLKLVTFTVDPERDNVAALKKYADDFHADPAQWFFLTGKKEELYKVIRDGFKAAAERDTQAPAGFEFIHSSRIYLVDGKGNIRAFYDGTDEQGPQETSSGREIPHEFLEQNMTIEMLPSLNACLNSLSAVLLLTGYFFIKSGNKNAHRVCMVSAFIVSIVFLISYLVHHALAGIVYFPGHGAIKIFYLVLLTSHTILAILVPVLAVITLRRALKGDFEKHRKIARVTFPIWLYVSVTGVLVYFMLYRGFLQ